MELPEDRRPRFPASATRISVAWLLVLVAFYFGYTTWRTRSLYEYIKTGQRGWAGHVHRADADLGFAQIPDSRGAEVFPVGPPIPMRYDEDGFRVPVANGHGGAAGSEPRPVVLALGCSFTYGAANPAEETWPHLVGRALGGTTRNAGVCAYGLSQMVILAGKLVPLVKPDILIVQYSPWLSERSLSPFAPTYFGRFPAPYFGDDDELTIHPPVFRPRSLDLPMDRYRATPRSAADFVSFLSDVGLPLYLHDDANMVLFHGRRVLGIVPRPGKNRELIEGQAYRQIVGVARDHAVKVVIVILGNTSEPVDLPGGLFPEGSLVVDAHAALVGHLPAAANEETWNRVYALWRGDPPRLVDSHPNAKAHGIIAEEIVRAIEADREAHSQYPSAP